ncbi:cytochrome C oxidase subunit IV family protein [Haloferula sp. BvORR071]|uniref:cytochrome C oxidase subunit IV family protein n=1 Tax=Haloferula sp. BvORR071 TaxID=1396141 RepID=UPI0005527B8B|nr:cytochrome C oxidase subunit IV family protein [Haloferula sp. BvORR071]
MAGDSPEAIKKAVRLYLLIGAVLFGGTLLTVAVAMVPWLDFGQHGFDTADLCIGLAIATVKATLVALIFMHLNHERRLVYWLFGFGLVAAFFLVALIGLAKWDPIHYNGFKTGVPGSEHVVPFKENR